MTRTKAEARQERQRVIDDVVSISRRIGWHIAAQERAAALTDAQLASIQHRLATILTTILSAARDDDAGR
jgi:hypothetical protein